MRFRFEIYYTVKPNYTACQYNVESVIVGVLPYSIIPRYVYDFFQGPRDILRILFQGQLFSNPRSQALIPLLLFVLSSSVFPNYRISFHDTEYTYYVLYCTVMRNVILIKM